MKKEEANFIITEESIGFFAAVEAAFGAIHNCDHQLGSWKAATGRIW